MFKKANLLVLIILSSSILVTFLIYQKILPPFKTGLNINRTQKQDIKNTPSPTNLPFSELTIRSLKNKEYKSKLGELKLFQQYRTFNSYLTDYTSENLKINGLITVPTSKQPENGFPAIIFIHGYIPPTRYKTTERYTDYVNSFAREGFVVFKIDLRGHGDSEGEATGAYFSPNYVIDTLNAYEALKNSDFVNKNLIGLWGHSMAGNIVVRALAVNDDIKAGVVWAGAVYTYKDLIEYGIGDNSYVPPTTLTGRRRTRQEIIEIYGQPNTNEKFWQEISPATYIKKIGPRIQLHHPIDDNVVSVEYSRNLSAIAKENDINISFFEYKTGGHNLTGTTFIKAITESVKFYKAKFDIE
jgi:dipeptidyl aminopeptidase/acylaminoacyl peptidase